MRYAWSSRSRRLQPIKIRNDVVHRNGRQKDGTHRVISTAEITDLIDLVRGLAIRIDLALSPIPIIEDPEDVPFWQICMEGDSAICSGVASATTRGAACRLWTRSLDPGMLADQTRNVPTIRIERSTCARFRCALRSGSRRHGGLRCSVKTTRHSLVSLPAIPL
jgi:hypothetical protein